MDKSSPHKSSGNEVVNHILPVSIIGILVITCILYWPALNGTFLLDDHYTLRSLNKLGGVTSFTSLKHFLTDGPGALGRPVSMLSLLIDDQYYPGDPAKYRYTNILLHLLCGLFLLLFVTKILAATKIDQKSGWVIAVLVFAFWLMHPLNVSTTAYIVQRMTQVMTLFTVIGLTLYITGRIIMPARINTGAVYISAALLPFGLLAVLSKENGILICVYIFAVELTVGRNLPRPCWFKYWFSVFVIAPIILLIGYLAYSFNSHYATYAYRDFTLSERLLTEFRILVSYLHQIIIPPSSGTGLYHDDIPISTSPVSPFTTLPSILLVTTLLVFAVRLRKTQPVFSLAILWFFGGHILESTFIPLELYFEHRNYLPMVGPILCVTYYSYIYASKLKNPIQQQFVKAIPVALIVISALFTFQSTTIWAKPELMYRVWHEEHPNSLRAATMHAKMFEKYGNYSKAIELLDQTYQKHPDTVSLLLYILKISCENNITPKYSVQSIIEASKNARYRELLPSILKSLIQTKQNNICTSVTTEDLISLVKAIENIQGLRKFAKVEIILMLSDLYVSQGQLSPAIETLDHAFQLKKLPTIAVKQAELLASAGLYKEALTYIEIARMADSKQSATQASYTSLITAMEKQIQNEMEKKSTVGR